MGCTVDAVSAQQPVVHVKMRNKISRLRGRHAVQLANEGEDELKRERMKGRKEVAEESEAVLSNSWKKLRLFGQSAAIGIAESRDLK